MLRERGQFSTSPIPPRVPGRSSCGMRASPTKRISRGSGGLFGRSRFRRMSSSPASPRSIRPSFEVGSIATQLVIERLVACGPLAPRPSGLRRRRSKPEAREALSSTVASMRPGRWMAPSTWCSAASRRSSVGPLSRPAPHPLAVYPGCGICERSREVPCDGALLEVHWIRASINACKRRVESLRQSQIKRARVETSLTKTRFSETVG